MRDWIRVGFIACVIMLLIAGCRSPQSRSVRQAVAPSLAPAPAIPALVTVDELAQRLDAARMSAHVRYLAGAIGVRQSGTAAERQAGAYVADQLRSYGYQVREQSVPLPGGRHSLNIIAEPSGALPSGALLIGAHLDSKPPSPGANDNASGVAVMLELARVLRDADPAQPCIFAAFGAEEIIDRHRDHHHYGSRLLAADAGFRARLAGMISPDMVGDGKTLHIMNQGWAPDTWRDRIAYTAKAHGLAVRTGRSKPQSDHEAFERHGVPCAYLHRGINRRYHRATDTPAYVDPELLRQTTEVLLRAVMDAR
jgi:hypothetical protein